MTTFTEIHYNGNEYKQMWLNGTKIWEKDSGGIVYPYPDADSVVTYRVLWSMNNSFNIIDSSLPYYINEEQINSKYFDYGTHNLKLINLIHKTNDGFIPLNIEQLRIPNLTDLSSLFKYFCYKSGYKYSWQPQYFEFNENPTSMNKMFYNCKYLTDDMMNQFIPYFPNTSEVTDMCGVFINCESLTSLDLTNFDTSNLTTMQDMFYGCNNLKTLDLSSFDTSKVTGTVAKQNIFYGVHDCTIYISDKWTLGTSPSLGDGSNLTFIRVVPITNITLESTLTDTTITKGTQFTITPTITPTDYSGDELVITYDENYLSMVDNTFTVLDTATIGQQLDITYSSKNNPSVSTTYSVTIRDFATIESIVLQHSLESLVIEPNTTFTITPIITPTVHDDELMIEFDNTYITNDNGTFTITNAPFSEQLSIRYYSKLNPTVSATLDLTVREFIPITSIVLTHTLESLTDVAIGTTFTVVPTIEPTSHDDELLVDYDTNYLSKDGDNYTVLGGASGQTVQVIYYSKHNNNVNAILEFTVEEKAIIVYPYDDADSVITYRNTSTSSKSITFEVIDSTLPYSINGTSTNSFTFPSSSETQLKFVNLKPRSNTSSVIPINIEQLRIPKLTDLSYLFYYFCYDSNYTYSWSPQYFEFNENPTNMYQMFSQCRYLTDDMMNQFMPYFPNTSNVTSMYSMFSNCLSLTSLNLSNFNTSSATTMYQMFFGCNKLTLLDVSNFDTSNVTTMSGMFWACSKLTSLDLSSFNTSQVTTMSYMFYNCPLLTSLDLSNFDTSQVTNMNGMFDSCTSLTSLGLSSFDTSKVTKYTEMFEKVSNCTIYRGYKWTLGTSSTLGNGTNLTFVYPPIKSITLESSLTDTINVSQFQFTIIPTIAPVGYLKSDLEIIYDSTYMNIDNNKVILKDGCQGQTLSITYRSKENNSISDTLTFTVSQDLEIPLDIDFTQSTAPTLPSCMTLDGQGSSYYFKHGTYTTNVYGLVPNNSGKHNTTAYTRYKFVAPKDGVLTFTYRCYAETNYDYLTVHVDTSTSQPSYSSSTNQVFTTKGVSSYQTTDGTASINVTKGTTYYIHIQYCKDSRDNSGYDKGCIRKIELL